MKPTSDDPRLTAYALDELDAEEHAAIEAELRASPELQAEVDDIRRASSQLSQELANEACPNLSATQLEDIQAEVLLREEEAREPKWKPAQNRREKPMFRFTLIEALVIIAILGVMAAILLPSLSKAKHKAQRVTQLNEQKQRDLERSQLQQEAELRAPRRKAPSAQPPPRVMQPAAQLARPTAQAYSPPADIPVMVAPSRLPLGEPYPYRGAEAYDQFQENLFRRPEQDPLSTFSIDVDTASYSLVRRFIEQQRRLPPTDAVRIEEMINYFDYDYPQPRGGDPFSVNVEIAGCPWQPEHRLARIGIKGREISRERSPACNLVFLVDVSGSMQAANKLPLVKRSLQLLATQLDRRDSVAMVVYAGSSGAVLPPTPGDQQRRIITAIEQLQAGGSTHGSAGIRQAYQEAERSFIDDGVNRVILCTDGDFNVGITSRSELTDLIEQKARTGVFLSVLGFGMGNLKDSTLETLADKGNGNYGYIDTFLEAQKVFGEQLMGTLVTIAKDVKIQVEFNPAQVGAYRLIGYENRVLQARDFNDDRKDAGEIGAGHTVTALYEIVPPGVDFERPGVDPLKYQEPPRPLARSTSDELMTVKLRYKQPDGDRSQLIERPVKDRGRSYARASGDFKFAASVAAFGMVLRDSPYRGSATLDGVLELSEEGLGRDKSGYQTEFIQLVKEAQRLDLGGTRNRRY